MSAQIFPNKLLYNLDKMINGKLGIILTNEAINEKYLDLGKLDQLEESLISSSLQANDYNELPRESLIEILSLMKVENKELANLLNQVNKERKTLKQQNFQLIERLFCFENFCIEKFDRDFNRFLSKTIFVNYEISKIFLEKERENAEKLQGIIHIKDEEILSLKTKISMLEQRVIESRNMLKKTLLETSPLKQKNENTPIKAGGLRIPTKSSLEMNKQLYRQRESPQKTSSPSSQQDTTSDSLIRTSINDANKNIANLHRKDISELLTQNHLDVDKQAFNYERFSTGLRTLEDNLSGEIDLIGQTQGRTIGSSMSTIPKTKLSEPSPSKVIRKDYKDNRVVQKSNTIIKPANTVINQTKNAQKDTLKVGPNQQVPTPSSRASTVKKDTASVKSPSNKINDSQSKFKFKPAEIAQGIDPENLTLSFLLDQNVSGDSINLQMPTSSTTVKDLENELKKRDVTSLTNNSKIEGKKQIGNVSMNKNTTEASKVKPKITINSSPIPVKKKNQSEKISS